MYNVKRLNSNYVLRFAVAVIETYRVVGDIQCVIACYYVRKPYNFFFKCDKELFH